MRSNGRLVSDLRTVKFYCNYTKYAEGSVLVEFGDTRVLCNVSIDQKVPSFLKGKGQGWLTAEYSMLPRATNSRGARESMRGRPAGRTMEIQRLIGRSLRAVLDLKRLGERTIHVDCDVIQADGGTRTAAITGSFVAIHNAVDKLLKENQIGESPITDFVAAVSVGIYNNIPMVDLDYQEDSQCETDMNLVMTGEGGFVEIQGTAEGKTFHTDELEEMLRLGKNAINRLVSLQKKTLIQA